MARRDSALSRFAPPTQRWFARHLGEPTRVQRDGWASIASGRHTLMSAPTGSGKTLAAFLHAIDAVATSPPPAHPGSRVLYVSPIKALAYDIERNLQQPIAGIAEESKASETFGEVTVGVRTGDTSARDRRRLLSHPADILITTPESLYLLLTSQARETLRSIETVIVDEIHAFAGGKRGAHLALSLERLAAITETEPQRIGLSATQKPLDEVARFLGGDRPVEIVDASEPPRLDIAIVVPAADMSAPQAPPGSRSLDADAPVTIWPTIYPRLVELVQAHRSTIIFCNSRRVAERIAQEVNELAGHELCRAHHGSVSRAQREHIEALLKAGELRALAATSSLELGIDMGAVDLVVQIESPGSVSRGLQRIGRAGHHVGDVSVGRLIPKFRGDLLETTVVTRGMLDGDVEAVQIPQNCLDVLAQQIVAACSVDSWPVDELWHRFRRAHSFRDLSRDAFVEVAEMLAGRYPSDDFAELRPRVIWDRDHDTLQARRGAKMVALVNGGTIPDRGLYGVYLGDKGPRIGELDEEMVHEARVGETFLLGASTWRIDEITRDRVVVRPAPGEPGKMPFWRGDGPGRPVELGRSLGEFLHVMDGIDELRGRTLLRDRYLLDDRAADNLLAYLREQREATSGLPSDRRIIIERFRDELGDWRLCILTPFGARIHAPWALALQATLSRRAGFDVQTLYTDDGIALRLADADVLPDSRELLPDPDELETILIDELAESSLFAARFRECAARALLLPKHRPGSRTPLWAQRLRAQNLLAVARQFPSFPIILETYRECMQDVFDLPALLEILRATRDGSIRVDAIETPSPSPFARSLVFAYVAAYLYEGDAPLAERRAQALTLDRKLLGEILGQEDLRELLDPRAWESLQAELQQIDGPFHARDADEAHDLLRRLGDLSQAELEARCSDGAAAAVEGLREHHRALRLTLAGEARWIAAEDAGRYRDALHVELPDDVPGAFLDPVNDALSGLIRRFARRHVPFTAAAFAHRYCLDVDATAQLLDDLVARGALTAGEFRPGGQGREYADAEVLRRLRRRSLAILRGEVAPVQDATFARFLAAWHGIATKQRGREALRETMLRLEGYPLLLSELETQVLPARVADYQSRMLDDLLASGEIAWVGLGAHGSRDGRVAFYRRSQASRLLERPPDELPEAASADLHRVIDLHLRERGACFIAEIATAADVGLEELLSALWDLVWAGRVTNDTLVPLRSWRSGPAARRGRHKTRGATGRWSSVESLTSAEASSTERWHACATMLLHRYGVVSRDAAHAEGIPGGFTDLGKMLRAMEDSGAARRGHFVDGLAGGQFALAGTVDRLRSFRQQDQERATVIAATDAANPFGALLSWPEAAGTLRPSRRVGAAVITVGGRPALFLEAGGKRIASFTVSSPMTSKPRSPRCPRGFGISANAACGSKTSTASPPAKPPRLRSSSAPGFAAKCAAWSSRRERLSRSLLRHVVDAGTRAHEVAVAVGVVDAGHVRPIFMLEEPRRRKRRLLARVRPVPRIVCEVACGMRRVLERVVLAIEPAVFDRGDLLADGDHRVAEAVELGLGLALGGLDHERARHRPRHGRRVIAVVHQALGDVFDLDARGLLERAAVDDELVGHPPVGAGVEHLVRAAQPRRHVVGVEDRRPGWPWLSPSPPMSAM